MDDNTLEKFVANMRAGGQSDEFIADSLLSAGHSELMILNALGVEHLSQLKDEDEDEADAELHVPSAYTVVDESGNPLISEDNLPKVVSAAPAGVTAPAQPAPKPIDRSRPPRSRSYPRPTPRHKQVTSKPKDAGFAKPTQEVAPAETEKPHLPTLDDDGNPIPETMPKKKKVIAQKPSAKTLPPKKYGHHTFDDFMGRIESHPELPASTGHSLEPGYENEELEVTKIETQKPVKQDVAAPAGPSSIDDLLSVQKEEAAAGPGGPDMDDLLDEKDLEELHKTPEPQAPPKAVDLKNVPQQPDIARVGHQLNDFRNSMALKIVVILIGVLVLVGLAASIITQITG